MNHPIVVKISENRDLKDYGLKAARYVLDVDLKDLAGPMIDGFRELIDKIEENEPLAAGMMIRKSDDDSTKMGITFFVIDNFITTGGKPALFFRSILLNGMQADEHYYSTIPDIIIQGMVYSIENFIIDTEDINLLSKSGFQVPEPGEVRLSHYHDPNFNYLTMSI